MTTAPVDPPPLPPTPVVRLDDEQLHLMTSLAESGVRVNMTVVVPGGVIFGQLISVADYIERLRAAMQQGLTPDAPRRQVEPAPATEWSTERREPFLHLADARFISGPTLMPQAGAGFLMRVRVADISAWSLGSLSQGAA